MTNNTNNLGKKIFDKLTYEQRQQFNKIVLDATYKAQKIYGFDMTRKPDSYSNTHNNEADAFKHVYLSWYLSHYYGRAVAKWLGNMHEDETPNASVEERNMDLWNNSIGRELADNINRNYVDIKKMSKDELSDFVSEIIVKKMRNGELITNPDDKRSYKNMMYDRLQDKDRIFYEGEYWDELDEDERRRYSKHYTNYKNRVKGNFPTKAELITKTLLGEYIYVNNYTRADGTKVNGYYRRRVTY